MKTKRATLSPSAKAFLLLMSKVKKKTPLEVMRGFNEEARQRKENSSNNSQFSPV